jgi:hypothetical protein
LLPDTTYYYKVSAGNNYGESAQSTNYGQATTQSSNSTPEAPAGITAEAQSASSIYISWDSVPGANGYSVYRTTSSYGTYSYCGSTYGVSDTSYTDTGLSPDTTYYYNVSAGNDHGESPQSTSYGQATTQSIDNVVVSLTEGVWHDGNMTVSGPEYYRFPVASGENYEVSWNDSYEGNYTKNLNVKVSAYYETNTVYIFTDQNSGYSVPATFAATSSGNVIIKVEPYFSGSTGTYAVKYQSFTPSYTVSGTIYIDNPGGPANGASVQLQRNGSNVGSPVSTAANGTYAILDVPAGAGYILEVSLSGYVTETTASFDVADHVANQDLILVTVITVDTVTISPANTSVDRGGTQTFSAEVTGNGNPAQTVTWGVSGNHSSGTTISAAGILSVAANEMQPSLTIEAASTVNPNVVGTTTVTVTMSATEIEAEAFKSAYGDILDKTVDNITVAEEGEVDTAIAAYNDLSQAAKDLLGAQRTLLDNLKTKIEEIKADQAEAEAFKTTYDDILDKTVADITLADEGDVNGALAVYVGLSQAVKDLLIAEKDLLDSLKVKIEEIKADWAEAETFKSNHNAILDKTVANITLADKGDVNDALAAYVGLSQAVKDLLGAQKTLLDSLKAKIDTLGVGSITLIYPTDAASNALTYGSIIISGSQTHDLIVSGDFDSYRWRVDGFARGSGDTLVLKAGDYALGIHQILLEVTLNGAVYSKSGFFTVQ